MFEAAFYTGNAIVAIFVILYLLPIDNGLRRACIVSVALVAALFVGWELGIITAEVLLSKSS